MQPKVLRILPGTFRYSSGAFARQDWRWQYKSANLESDKLKSYPRHYYLKKFTTSSNNSILFSEIRFPKSKKLLQCSLRFLGSYTKWTSRFLGKPKDFYKADAKLNKTAEHKLKFDSVNNALGHACEIALKQPLLWKQLVCMTDAVFNSATYALMTEDNADRKI